MIAHHPTTELLLNYTSGSLPSSSALVVATHVALCGQCRTVVQRLESVAGVFLENIDPAAMSDMLFAATMARLDEPEEEADTIAGGMQHLAVSDPRMPAPLRKYVGSMLENLPWRRMGGYFEEARLAVGAQVHRVALVRLKPGSLMPRHSHGGNEYTVVLAGGFSDGDSRFGVGDFSEKGAADTHQPLIDADDECLCLVAMDAPVKLTGLLGRIVNPFLRV